MKKALLLAALPLSVAASDKHVHGEAEIYLAINDHKVLIELESPAANIVGFEHQPNNDKQARAIRQAEKKLGDYTHILSLRGASCQLETIDIDTPFGEDGDHKDEHGHEKHGEHGHDEHKEHHEEHAHDEHKEHHDEHGHDEHKEHHDEHGHDEHKEHHDEHGHDEHKEHAHGKHKEHHDEHGHDEHKEHHEEAHAHKAHDHDEHEEDSHSSYRISYELHCSGTVTQATINAFKHFPALEKATVNWLTEDKQGSVFATPNSNTLGF